VSQLGYMFLAMGVGAFSAGALRLLQTGSMRVYAASLLTGVLLVLGYFLAR